MSVQSPGGSRAPRCTPSRGRAGTAACREVTIHRLRPTIIATLLGWTSSCTVSDVQPREVASVSVSPDQALIAVGQPQQFVASVLDANGSAVPGQHVSWFVTAPVVASVDANGLVVGLAAGSAMVTASTSGHAGSAALTVSTGNPSGSGDVTVDAGVVHQTMVGWDVVPFASHWQCGSAYFDTTLYSRYRDTVIALAADVGINRVRLPVRSGAENPTDYWHEFETSVISSQTFMSHWYEAINDNSNPQVINPAGFHFSEVDYTIAKVVKPLRDKLLANGEKLYVVLNFIQSQRTGAFQQRNDPAEYAEFMLAAFQHIQGTWGWVPDAIEVINEPDNGTPWTASQIANIIVATGDRLKAAGYTPAFVAPSTTSMTAAVTYFDQMVSVPGVLGYLKELSYHRYTGVTASALQAIGQRSVQYGIGSAMLEHLGSGYQDLRQDLDGGQNVAWEQYGLAGCGTDNGGGVLFNIDVSNPVHPVVTPQGRTPFLRQFYKYVRAGAIRIGASSTRAALSPLAFVNTSGRYTVVISTSDSATFTVGGLPAGRYGTFYTTGPNDYTPTQAGVENPEVAIAAHQALTAHIPGAGVITVYGKP